METKASTPDRDVLFEDSLGVVYSDGFYRSHNWSNAHKDSEWKLDKDGDLHYRHHHSNGGSTDWYRCSPHDGLIHASWHRRIADCLIEREIFGE